MSLKNSSRNLDRAVLARGLHERSDFFSLYECDVSFIRGMGDSANQRIESGSSGKSTAQSKSILGLFPSSEGWCGGGRRGSKGPRRFFWGPRRNPLASTEGESCWLTSIRAAPQDRGDLWNKCQYIETCSRGCRGSQDAFSTIGHVFAGFLVG